MKLILLPFLFMLTFTGISFAQLQFAPIIGVNISNFRISDKVEPVTPQSNREGLLIGINAKYLLSDHFNVQLETAFSQKGTLYQLDYEPYDLKLKLNYIDFSILSEYYLNKVISLNAGVSYGINIKEKYSDPQYNGLSGNFSNDFGLVGGLKVYIGEYLFIRPSYLFGLRSISETIHTNENGEQIGMSHIYNRSFQVALGYYIH